MKFKQLCAELEVPENRGKHWLYCLRRADLIPERGRKLKNEFSEHEAEYFFKIRKLLAGGCESVPEAIRIMRENPTPEEALDAYRRGQIEQAALAKKIKELRAELALYRQNNWWGRIKRRLAGIFKRIGGERGDKPIF